jgi:hypothetical protein
MAIAVATTSNTPTYGSRTNSTITAPSGIANGDLLVAVLHVGHASDLPALAVTAPAGWTEVTNSPAAVANPGDPYEIAMHVYWKVAASEAGNYTFTHAAAESEGYMYRLTGADTTTPIDATPATAVWVASVGQTTTLPSVTTVTNGAFIIAADSAWDAPGAGNFSGTTPTLVARRTGSISKIFDATLTTAGATGSRTRTNGNANNGGRWASIIVPIRPGSGVTNYSTAGGQGTLTEAGQVARLARSRLFSAVNGTLTLAGPTVNLIYSGAGSKSMPGGIGFPTLSGQAATLRRTRVMPAVQGTLTLSGQIADIDADRRTIGGQGILTLAGQANRLVYARKPTAGKGQLTLAGPVVNLIYSGSGAKVLPAGLGFPLLGGQQAILRYARKMAASRGTLLASGQTATLTYVAFEGDIVMPVSAGVLRMSGRDASLNVSRAVQQVGKLEYGRKVYLRRW